MAPHSWRLAFELERCPGCPSVSRKQVANGHSIAVTQGTVSYMPPEMLTDQRLTKAVRLVGPSAVVLDPCSLTESLQAALHMHIQEPPRHMHILLSQP